MKSIAALSLLLVVSLAGCELRREPPGRNETPKTTSGDRSSATERPKKIDINDFSQLRDVDVSTLREGFGVGDLAPDISGEDSAGVAFSLSDYRGKVVMLDFWGDW